MNLETLIVRLRNLGELLTPMEMEIAERLLVEHRERLANSLKTINNATGKLAEVISQRDAFQDELRQTRATLTKTHENAELVADRNLELERHLADEVRRRHNVGKNLEEQTERRIKAETELAQAKLTCAAFRAELTDVCAEKKKLNENLVAALQKVTELQYDNAALRKQVQLVDFTIECAELQAQKDRLEADYVRLATDKENLKKRVCELTTERDHFKMIANDKHRLLCEAVDRNAFTVTERDRTAAELMVLKRQAEERNKFSQEAYRLEQENKHLRSQLDDMTALAKKHADRAYELSQSSALDADLRAARTQISELQFELKELRDRANFLADKLKEARGGGEFYQKLANQHAATAHSIHERYAKLQEKLARVRDTLDSKPL